ncbi:MAG: hypothetical protein IJ752_02065 [Alphaproteobacteria bacterium]|nr:hypothetical protein [Alphaproteobacteria bacterium]
MKFSVLFLFCFFLFSCARDISDDSYQMSSVGEANRVGQGVIIDVRSIQIQGNSRAGTLTGGVAGGVAASTIGRGAGSVLASVGGALLGAFIGGVTEKELSEQKALQYIVRLADGNMITVIQGMKNRLAVGQRVFVLYGQETRLIPDNLPSS